MPKPTNIEEVIAPLDTDTEIVNCVDEESGDDYHTLLERKIQLDQLKKQTEEQLKATGDALLLMLASVGLERVRNSDGYTLKVGYGKSGSKIVATKLLERGVSVDDINYATEEGKPYSFCQVMPPKAGK